MTVVRTTSRSLAVVLIGTGLTTGAAPASASAMSTAFVTGGMLNGVVAVSTTLAWGVGTTTSGKALIVHWNGRSWSQSTPFAGNLYAVAAVTATNVWAVGATSNGKTLVVHGNGHRWRRVASPSPGNG